MIKNSKFSAILAHLNNHSFRHRFITLNVAKTLKSYKSDVAFTNILTVAMSAVRKLTLHASNSTMERRLASLTKRCETWRASVWWVPSLELYVWRQYNDLYKEVHSLKRLWLK